MIFLMWTEEVLWGGKMLVYFSIEYIRHWNNIDNTIFKLIVQLLFKTREQQLNHKDILINRNEIRFIK